MRRFWLTLILAFLPTLVCKADVPAFNDIPNQQIPSNLLRNNKTESAVRADSFEIRYGSSRLHFSSGPLQVVKLDHRTRSIEGNIFAFEKIAEASGIPDGMTVRDFEKIGDAVNAAGTLEDLKEVLSLSYYQLLEDKVTAGASSYAVLTMLQAIRPNHMEIMDFNISQDRGQLSVRGRSTFGLTHGLVHLVKEENTWKIDKEEWFAAAQESPVVLGVLLKPLPAAKKYVAATSRGLMDEISPDYKFNANVLGLTKVPYHKSRRAFNFVFFVKKNKDKSVQAQEVYDRDKKVFMKENLRTHMHVLWTGTRKLLQDQQVVHNQSPVDFSFANYDDGYSEGQWNLILPDKKPREVVISILMNF